VRSVDAGFSGPARSAGGFAAEELPPRHEPKDGRGWRSSPARSRFSHVGLAGVAGRATGCSVVFGFSTLGRRSGAVGVRDAVSRPSQLDGLRSGGPDPVAGVRVSSAPDRPCQVLSVEVGGVGLPVRSSGLAPW